jgi:CRP-like cAMP-binding protein
VQYYFQALPSLDPNNNYSVKIVHSLDVILAAMRAAEPPCGQQGPNDSQDEFGNSILSALSSFDSDPSAENQQRVILLAQTINFFKSLPENLVIQCMKSMQVEKFRSNQTIFRIGDVGDKFFVILKGSALVRVLALKSDKLVDATTLRSGDAFGELALINDSPRAATIIAKQDSIFLTLEKSAYTKILKRYQEACIGEDTDLLQSFGAFKHWHAAKSKRFYRAIIKREFGFNSSVYLEGDVAATMFIIIEGEFALLRQAEEIQESTDETYVTQQLISRVYALRKGRKFQSPIEVAKLVKGQFLGEEELLNPQPRQLKALCTTSKGVLWEVKKDLFELFVLGDEETKVWLLDHVKFKRQLMRRRYEEEMLRREKAAKLGQKETRSTLYDKRYEEALLRQRSEPTLPQFPEHNFIRKITNQSIYDSAHFRRQRNAGQTREMLKGRLDLTRVINHYYQKSSDSKPVEKDEDSPQRKEVLTRFQPPNRATVERRKSTLRERREKSTRPLPPTKWNSWGTAQILPSWHEISEKDRKKALADRGRSSSTPNLGVFPCRKFVASIRSIIGKPFQRSPTESLGSTMYQKSDTRQRSPSLPRLEETSISELAIYLGPGIQPPIISNRITPVKPAHAGNRRRRSAQDLWALLK